MSDSFVLTTIFTTTKKKRRADFLKISHSLTLACCCFVVFLSVRTHIYTHIHLARKGNEDAHTHTHTHIYKSLETTSYYYASRRVRTTLLSHIIIEKVDKKNATRNDVEHITTDFSNNAQR